MFFNLNAVQCQVIYNNQTIDPIELITTTKPVNITGGQNIGSYFSFGFPLKNRKQR
jgi:hypothetical protein